LKKFIGVLLSMLMVFSMSVMAFAEEYVVKPGDVLWKIAAENGTTYKELARINEIKNPHLIFPGQIIILNEKEDETMTNAQKAVALIESLGTSNMEPVGYINPNNYIQHNLGVKDGLEGFGEVVKMLPKGTYGKNIRVFQDGDYVVMHNDYNFFGPKVGFDIFRFENGLIVEHWDNLAEITPPNPSGRTQLDGAVEVKDLEKTDANKLLIDGFVKDVLMGAAPDKITDYVSTETYLQHNSSVADGLDGLGAALQALAEAGTPMVYEKNHMILGQGNFVLTVSEGQFLGKHVSYYDLFRVEDGKIVEHWDVIEEIPAKDKWMNNNGKF
jgi:predicted SnoaL-like aldol condensation-catalyzing enzyme